MKAIPEYPVYFFNFFIIYNYFKIKIFSKTVLNSVVHKHDRYSLTYNEVTIK
jgi:hypothetical protein